MAVEPTDVPEAATAFDPFDRVDLGTDAPVANLHDTLEQDDSSTLFTGPFTRLWLAQVVASLGDWIGLLAIITIATRLSGGGSSGTSVGVVMLARTVPGFFFASFAGVLVDRWDRKRVMVLCNIGRAGVLALLPFVDDLFGLVLASLALELMTLLWSPSKEASVPNLVPASRLSAANSLSLVAAYGTFPIAAVASALLVKASESIGDLDPEVVQLWFNSGAFLVSAALIATLTLPRPVRRAREQSQGLGAIAELREGWRTIAESPVVRAVMIGLATGLFGGGMVVPLGSDFGTQVLGGGPATFNLLMLGLGLGVAAGVSALSVLQRRLPMPRIFVLSAFLAGGALALGASMSALLPAFVCVAVLGVAAGAVYVVGFTLLHETVADEVRGRVFATLYTVVRLSLLLALTLAPFLSELLGSLSRGVLGSDRALGIGGSSVALPGVRLTFYFGAAVILGAGVLAARVMGAGARADTAGR